MNFARCTAATCSYALAKSPGLRLCVELTSVLVADQIDVNYFPVLRTGTTTSLHGLRECPARATPFELCYAGCGCERGAAPGAKRRVGMTAKCRAPGRKLPKCRPQSDQTTTPRRIYTCLGRLRANSTAVQNCLPHQRQERMQRARRHALENEFTHAECLKRACHDAESDTPCRICRRTPEQSDSSIKQCWNVAVTILTGLTTQNKHSARPLFFANCNTPPGR